MCSLVQVVRVVIVRVILVGVRCVTVVHIGHDEVLVVIQFYEAIFVVIFCNWSTLYTMLELFSSKVSVDQNLSVIVAETINDDDVKQRLIPIVFTRA